MAQLPPKSPTSTIAMPPVPSWSGIDHLHQFLHPAAASAQSSWTDEFLDFSSARLGARRSVNDEIAFAPDDGRCSDFLDDDQLMSIFSDAVTPSIEAPAAAPMGAVLRVSLSAPSTPSDHNSGQDEKQATTSDRQTANESEEAQSSCKTETTPASTSAPPAAVPDADPRRVRRILANRQSAQRSRVRKLQYISELERSVSTLQTEVSTLSPRVAFLDHQRSILAVGNSHLKQRIAALMQDKIFKDAHQEALKKERERLRQVYNQQNLKNVVDYTSNPAMVMRNEEELLS